MYRNIFDVSVIFFRSSSLKIQNKNNVNLKSLSISFYLHMHAYNTTYLQMYNYDFEGGFVGLGAEAFIGAVIVIGSTPLLLLLLLGAIRLLG